MYSKQRINTNFYLNVYYFLNLALHTKSTPFFAQIKENLGANYFLFIFFSKKNYYYFFFLTGTKSSRYPSVLKYTFYVFFQIVYSLGSLKEDTQIKKKGKLRQFLMIFCLIAIFFNKI